MGARKFAIINVGLTGRLPIARVLSAAGACSDSRNKLAAGFNDALRSLLAGLAAPRLPGLVYSLADSYGIMATVFADPRASGFTDVSSACCGTGRLGVGGTICANHDQHYFWDGTHPSQRATLLRVHAQFFVCFLALFLKVFHEYVSRGILSKHKPSPRCRRY